MGGQFKIWIFKLYIVAYNQYPHWQNDFFLNRFLFWNCIFSHHLLWYCEMSSEIIHNVAYDNYDDFQHVNSIFSQNFISLFWGLFNDKTNLRVR
jgi:hypothetical protein